jgi:hypothetical protein
MRVILDVTSNFQGVIIAEMHQELFNASRCQIGTDIAFEYLDFRL